MDSDDKANNIIDTAQQDDLIHPITSVKDEHHHIYEDEEEDNDDDDDDDDGNNSSSSSNGDSKTTTSHFKIRLPSQAHSNKSDENLNNHNIVSSTNGNDLQVKNKMLPPSITSSNNNNHHTTTGTESNGGDSDATTTPPPTTGQSRPPYKSFRKKYKKMRATFDSVMHGNDSLFYSDLRARRMIKRLSMQNAYLLDILLDMNNSTGGGNNNNTLEDIMKRVDELYPITTAGADRPSHENPDISLRDNLKQLWFNFMNVDVDVDFDSLHNEARHYNSLGQDSSNSNFDIINYVYQSMDDDEGQSDSAKPKKKSSSKKGPKIHHYRYNEDGVLVDQESGQIVPVVGPNHQPAADKEKVKNVDMVFTTPDCHDRTERNPMSALAWLRVNQPQVFLQEIEEQKRTHRKQQQRYSHSEGKAASSGGKKSAGNSNKKSNNNNGDSSSDIQASSDNKKRKASFDNNNNNHNQAMSVVSLVAAQDNNNNNNNNVHNTEGSKRPKVTR